MDHRWIKSQIDYSAPFFDVPMADEAVATFTGSFRYILGK
jgi:hypothetical protein